MGVDLLTLGRTSVHGARAELGSRLPSATYWRRCDERDEGRYAELATV